MSVEAIEPLAIVTDYNGLVAALRRRIIELDTSLEAVDEVAGLPARYTSKALGRTRGLGRTSLGPLLGALAVKLAVVPDNEALARIRHRLPPRQTTGGERLQVDYRHNTKACRKAARELAAALVRLRRGTATRSATEKASGR
jgi:hypothetical protein